MTFREHNLSEKFSVFIGVRKGDSLSTFLFNVMLGHTIKELMSRETLASKMTQINVYADDVMMMMARSKKSME
jgi:Reverse transcriptase (RNA-dependent DNA polymerase).